MCGMQRFHVVLCMQVLKHIVFSFCVFIQLTQKYSGTNWAEVTQRLHVCCDDLGLEGL